MITLKWCLPLENFFNQAAEMLYWSPVQNEHQLRKLCHGKPKLVMANIKNLAHIEGTYNQKLAWRCSIGDNVGLL